MSVNSDPQDHRKTIQDIEVGSKKVEELATRLSKRITAFEEWINGLRGRVEASVWIGVPNADSDDPRNFGFGLRLHRDSKRWKLSYAFEQMDEDLVTTWHSLVDGDLDTKMCAVKTFPLLLEKIKNVQEIRINELQEVHAAFDALALAVGMKKEDN